MARSGILVLTAVLGLVISARAHEITALSVVADLKGSGEYRLELGVDVKLVRDDEVTGNDTATVADPNAPSPLEKTVDRELREKVEATLEVLNAREQEIIRLRFGIGRDMPYTLEEIGRVMGLSRERVRQIEATALKKIQSAQECRHLREFLA